MRLVLLLFMLLASPAAAADWDAVRAPGAILMMRHATAPGTGDPDDFRLGDCATQRNLSEAGRAQSRALGQGLRDNGLTSARVMTSQWCRTRETAELLGFGPPEDLPPLNSFFEARGSGPAQTQALRDWLAAQPAGQTLILVTHQVNITALTGLGAASGATVVLRHEGDALRVTGTLPPP